MRVASLAAIAASLGLVTVGASQVPSEFRSDTHTVSLWATVVDRHGRLVPGLGREDFEVYDNGVRQDIAVFANEVQPITVVMLLDRSVSVRKHFELVRRAAETFVDELGPDDKARIGSFSSEVRIDPEGFTSSRRELVRILRDELQEAGPTPLWNATAAAMTALAHEPGRRVVLLFTDGSDSPGPGPSVTFAEIRRRAQMEDIMVYGIGLAERCGSTTRDGDDGEARRFQRRPGAPRGPQGRPGMPGTGREPVGPRRPGVPIPGFPPTVPGVPLPPRVPTEPLGTAFRCAETRPDPGLRELVEAGGGGYFELDSTADLLSTFARVADELHQQYRFGFVPSELDDQLHQIDVRVKRPGLTARSRTTYFAGEPSVRAAE